MTKLERILTVVPVFEGQKQLPRGKVHQIVCEALKIKLNNHNVTLIKAALRTVFEVREVRIRGFQYYKFEQVKDCNV